MKVSETDHNTGTKNRSRSTQDRDELNEKETNKQTKKRFSTEEV